MQECEFIVIVARGSTEPDFESIRAFRARPGQGICYHAGTWHHPMVAQIQTTSFFVLTYEDGSKLDCEEFQVVPQQVFVVETSG
jgi:ureidoglycolate lyase